MKFKIHRCNCRKLWSIQTRKTKFTAISVLVDGRWGTELKPQRKYNPKGFVTTNAKQDIIVNPTVEEVGKFEKVAKLIYDKKNVNFNVHQGESLFFAEDGTCYLLKRL
ncbi:hypothetical protein M3610_14000 [Neobacillus sp. MER 74]|uniref:hypothetical protein n=1 Tax=Bacillaceae TaxID=186817 RepID=UPI000BF8F568|nr:MULTISPECIES: hypothetical protein [Bacillaceae]MCM3116413.1 hypothetical protein [Neobacillus sp. MER 74]PFP27534.1 hypothetical protein COJ96_14980 [Bacillus sp. AFS073361]